MSVLDIIIWIVGELLIATYGFFAIRKYLKFKKQFKHYVKTGLTQIQAKEQAMKDIYPKKAKKAEKDNNQHDTIYED